MGDGKNGKRTELREEKRREEKREGGKRRT